MAAVTATRAKVLVQSTRFGISISDVCPTVTADSRPSNDLPEKMGKRRGCLPKCHFRGQDENSHLAKPASLTGRRAEKRKPMAPLSSCPTLGRASAISSLCRWQNYGWPGLRPRSRDVDKGVQRLRPA